eukprot:6409282-Prymnesium_polylepis.1
MERGGAPAVARTLAIGLRTHTGRRYHTTAYHASCRGGVRRLLHVGGYDLTWHRSGCYPYFFRVFDWSNEDYSIAASFE